MPFRMPPPAQHPSTLTPSSSAPSLAGTLRLPAPPPPPKPLHLTMSVRGRAAAFERGTVTPVEADEAMGAVGSGESRRSGRRGALPRWSVVEGECDDGEHCGGEDSEQKETDEARRMVDSLFPSSSSANTPRQATTNPPRRDPSGASTKTTTTTSSGGGSEFRTPVGTLRTPHSYAAGSSSRGASTYTVTGMDGRRSIYFDATRENPFVPPSPPSAPAEEAGAGGGVEEEPTTAGSTFTLHGKTSSSSLLASDPPPPPTPTPGPLINDPHFLALPLHASPAISLHAFEGEPQFGELSFEQGVWMRVEIEEMGEGWSLGYVEAEGEEGRGLIPRGYYAYVDPPPEEQQVPASPPPLPSPARSASPSTPTLPSLPHEDTPSSTRTVLPVTPPGAATVPFPPSAPATPAAAYPAAPPSTPPTQVRPSPLSVFTTSATDLGLGAIPRDSPYATRSIGRHVVVSGTEFEPIPSPVSAGGGGTGTTLSAEAELEAAGEMSVEELLAQQEEEGKGARMTRRASQISGEESEAELAAIEDEVWRVHEEEMRAKEASVVVEEEQDGAGDLPKSASAVDEPTAPLSPPTPPFAEPTPPFTPARTAAPPAPPSSTFLNFLGLSSPSGGGGLTFRLPVPLPLPGRSTIPGASVLAATSAPASPAKKRRLPRLGDRGGAGGGAAGAYEGREVLMRWVREGDEADEAVLREVEVGGEVQVWDVETGPAWRPLAEPFTVQLHSPVKHTPLAGAAYTTYSLTSTFWSFPASEEADESTTSTTVSRRYSHFVALHALLSARFLAPLVHVPALPSKAFGAARFADGFVETRRRELERWVERVGRHPVLGGSEELRRFLEIEDDKELHRHLLLSHPSSLPPASALSSTSKARDALFPARVFHPEFNLDLAEAEELVERFEAHCRGVVLGGGWRDVERAVGKGREGERAEATDLLTLSHSLIRLSAGLALPPASYDKPSELEERETELERQQRRAREWGLQDGRGGMGWKEEDDDALCLAKAMQGTAEALASVADLKDDAARTSLLRVHEVLREHAEPYSQYLPLIDLHRALLAEYRRLSRLSSSSSAGQEPLNRCETALNITCAEMERIRAERNEDLKEAVEGWLDAMISVQEQSLAHLHQARALFSPETYPSLALTGPRLRSPLEARLSSSSSPFGVLYPPLPQPSGTGAGAGAALSAAGKAVGSVFLPVAGASGGGRLRRAQTVTGALSTGVRGRREYDLDEDPDEEDEDAAGGAVRERMPGEVVGGPTSWRESIWGGTMSLFR